MVELLIDKAKYFNAIEDDVMGLQSDLNNLSMWADDAAQQMKITIDTDVLAGILHAAKAVENRGIAAGKISGDVNLGVTGTPLSVVARNPSGGDVEIIEEDVTFVGFDD